MNPSAEVARKSARPPLNRRAARDWYRAPRRDAERRNAGVIAALALGAGMTGQEIADARVADVVGIGSDQVFMTVFSPAPRLVALGHWLGDEVVRAIEGREPADYLLDVGPGGLRDARAADRFIARHSRPLEGLSVEALRGLSRASVAPPRC